MIEKQLRKDLAWHQRGSRPDNDLDTRVAKLVKKSDNETIGYVCSTSRGFLWFTNTRMIRSKFSFEAVSQSQAEEQLFEYAVSQLLAQVQNIMPISIEGVDAASDRAASKEYAKQYGKKSFTLAFACGVDYILKRIGIARPPEWAKYRCQDFDGVWKYCEDIPVLNTAQNRWYSRTGRTVADTHPSWMHSVRRITL